MDTAKEIFTREEAAQFLRISKNTLANWGSRGCGPAISYIGDRPMYTRANLDAYLSSNTYPSTVAAKEARK